MQQVAGLTQIAGELMQRQAAGHRSRLGRPQVGARHLKDTAFVAPHEATTQRQALVNQYVAAFRHVEVGTLDKAASGLRYLASSLSTRVISDEQPAIKKLLDAQLAKLA